MLDSKANNGHRSGRRHKQFALQTRRLDTRRQGRQHQTSSGRAKIGYATISEAQQAVREILVKRDKRLQYYLCPSCEKYHLGSRKKRPPNEVDLIELGTRVTVHFKREESYPEKHFQSLLKGHERKSRNV